MTAVHGSRILRGSTAAEEEHTMGNVDIIAAARAEALFTSTLPTGSAPTRTDTELAIRQAVHSHGGVRGCASLMAYGYGDYPEAAANRMRWARGVITANYPRQRPGRRSSC
jgi:hypothetical protein